MATDKNDRSLGTLFSELTWETTDLIRKEVALVRAEMSEKVSSAQTGLTSVAIGAAVLLAGLILVLMAISNALAMALPPDLAPWLAPLIVGLVVAVIGYAMLKGGSTKLQPNKLMPHRTMDSLRRDRTVAREAMR